MLAVTFGSRLTGLLVRMRLPPFWLRFLHFVPIAVFAALVTPSLAGIARRGRDPRRRGDLAGLVAWRTRHLALAIAVGMAAFWLLRLCRARPQRLRPAEHAAGRVERDRARVPVAARHRAERVSKPVPRDGAAGTSEPGRGPESSRHAATSVAPFHET